MACCDRNCYCEIEGVPLGEKTDHDPATARVKTPRKRAGVFRLAAAPQFAAPPPESVATIFTSVIATRFIFAPKPATNARTTDRIAWDAQAGLAAYTGRPIKPFPYVCDGSEVLWKAVAPTRKALIFASSKVEFISL